MGSLGGAPHLWKDIKGYQRQTHFGQKPKDVD